MFPEKELKQHPVLIKAFMGLPAEVFWALVAAIEACLPEYERERLDRSDRQRAIGGGVNMTCRWSSEWPWD